MAEPPVPIGRAVLQYRQRKVLFAPASSITFSSIPQTYNNLRLVFCGQSTNVDGSPGIFMQANGDSGAGHYRWSYFGSDANADGQGGDVRAMVGRMCALDVDTFGGSMFDLLLPNYAGSFTKNWFSRSSFHDLNFGQLATMIAGEWDNTAAITSLVIFPEFANFQTGTTITLYLDY